MIGKSNYANLIYVLEDTQNGEATLPGYITTLKSCALVDSFVCFSTNNVQFRRLDLPGFLRELLILYSVTDFAYMLTTQGNDDLRLLETDQEVFPAVLPSKVAEVEGCIRMYEEMHRLKGKVKKEKVEGVCESQESYIPRCNNALVEVAGQ